MNSIRPQLHNNIYLLRYISFNFIQRNKSMLPDVCANLYKLIILDGVTRKYYNIIPLRCSIHST